MKQKIWITVVACISLGSLTACNESSVNEPLTDTRVKPINTPGNGNQEHQDALIAEDPVTEEPVVEVPVVDEPVVDEPVVEYPVTEKPAVYVLDEQNSGFCFVDGEINSDNEGFTGSGFINTDNTVGSSILWSINANQAGVYPIEIRYANGGETARAGLITVDGAGSQTVTLNSTGAWTSWQTETIDITLESGDNAILIKANGMDGLANIDKITLTGNGLSNAQCTEIQPPVVEDPVVGLPTTPVLTLTHKKGFPDLWGEGAGNIEGGRGGTKFFITSLSDAAEANLVPASSGADEHYEGTLRGALTLGKARQIIPKVSGVVALSSNISVNGTGEFSYHGHLAPEGGLSVTNKGLVISRTEDFVIRFLRLRYGEEARLGSDDVLSVLKSQKFSVDHSSFAWGGDETFSIGGALDTTYSDIIVQNNILGQSREGHNTGTLIGWTDAGYNAHGSVNWHNNIYVGVSHRTPNFAGDTEMYGRIYNNIAYDWYRRLTNLVGAPTVDVAYNYYKMGPLYSHVSGERYNKHLKQEDRPYAPSIFSEGNIIMPAIFTDPEADNKALWADFKSGNPLPDELFRENRLSADGDVGYSPTTAEEAYERNVVAKEAGANRSTDADGNALFALDSVDDNYLTAIIDGTDATTDESNWVHPAVADSTPYSDENWNGIADSFETAHNITSSDNVIVNWDFGDYLLVNDAGYTAFEVYSAWVAGDFQRLLP